MILKQFLTALMGSKRSIVESIAVVVFSILSLLAQTDIQIRAFALTAVACVFLVSIRVWATERRRAEMAEAELTKEPRPRVMVDSYSATHEQSEGGEENLVETLRFINKGDAPAIAVTMRPLQISGRTARLFASIPNLAAGELKEIRVLNLRRTLERAAEKAIKAKGHALSVRLPLSIEYQDFRHERWISEHIVLFGIDGISVDVVCANKPPQWTAISKPRGF
jgi:hypothetical protein